MPLHKRRGFTLIELLVVIAIIALLMSILMPALGQAKEHAKSVICLTNLRNIGTAVQGYGSSNRDYFVAGTWVYEGGQADSWASILTKDGYFNAPMYYGSDRVDLDEPAPAQARRATIDCPNSSGTVEMNPSQGPFDPQTSQRVFGLFPFAADTEADQGDIYSSYGFSGNNNDEQMPMVFHKRGEDSKPLSRMPEAPKPADLAMLYEGSWSHNTWAPNRIGAYHMQAQKTNVVLADGHAEPFDRADLPMEELSVNYLDDHCPYPLWRYDQ